MQPTKRQLADFAQGIRQNNVYEQIRLSRVTHSTRDESGRRILRLPAPARRKRLAASLPIAAIASACGILIVNQLRP